MHLKPGPLNLITDVPGLTVGNATDERSRSGVTTVLCDRHTTAGVDVRGGAPGVRETDTLAPDSLVGAVHAVVLSGGSVFGLAAADGVTMELSDRDVGLRIADGPRALPIVPAAVLHDLTNGGDKHWGEPPYRVLGRNSVGVATREFALGAVGAGREDDGREREKREDPEGPGAGAGHGFNIRPRGQALAIMKSCTGPASSAATSSTTSSPSAEWRAFASASSSPTKGSRASSRSSSSCRTWPRIPSR